MAPCSSKLSHRIWLARELSPVLSKSSLGIIARKENQEVADALVRIEQLYTSNYHFLDLLRTQNQVLLEASGVDAELMELPHVRCHFTAEMEECRRLTEEAQEMRTQLAEANRRLAEAASDRAARKQQLEALESSNQAARHRLEALESSNQAARQQLEALESSNQGARQQLEALESSIAFKTALRVRRWRRKTCSGTKRPLPVLSAANPRSKGLACRRNFRPPERRSAQVLVTQPLIDVAPRPCGC